MSYPYDNEEEDYLDNDDFDEDDYEEIDPDDYKYNIVEAIEQIIKTECTNNTRLLFPIVITPINKYYRFPDYGFTNSLLMELINNGMEIGKAVEILYNERIGNYFNDYIIIDDDGNVIDEDELADMEGITDDMYPNVHEPFWYINLKD